MAQSFSCAMLQRIWTARRMTHALLVITVTMLSAACSKSPKAYQTHFSALGTEVDISFWSVDEKKADQATQDIREIMDGVEKRWHAWRPSELTQINAHIAHGEKAMVDAKALGYLKKAAALSIASGDRFNPGIGQLIRLWGFADDEPPHGPPPTQEKIKELLQHNISMTDLQFDSDGISSRNAALQLDLGGWAKTIALDGAIVRLRALEINNAIVNVGGDLRVLGAKGDQPWKLGIRNPRGAGVIASVTGQGDESVFTSGDYERYFDWEGVRYQHIIDPKTGRPASGVASVTVIHHDTALAEAASKAILIAGVQGWRQVSTQLGVTQVMLITPDLHVYLTPEMAHRVNFVQTPPAKDIVP